jgi:hypothetical protein
MVCDHRLRLREPRLEPSVGRTALLHCPLRSHDPPDATPRPATPPSPAGCSSEHGPVHPFGMDRLPLPDFRPHMPNPLHSGLVKAIALPSIDQRPNPPPRKTSRVPAARRRQQSPHRRRRWQRHYRTCHPPRRVAFTLWQFPPHAECRTNPRQAATPAGRARPTDANSRQHSLPPSTMHALGRGVTYRPILGLSRCPRVERSRSALAPGATSGV